jgi:hypothetical protein
MYDVRVVKIEQVQKWRWNALPILAVFSAFTNIGLLWTVGKQDRTRADEVNVRRSMLRL